MIGILRNFLRSFGKLEYLVVFVINLGGLIAMLDTFNRTFELSNKNHYCIMHLGEGQYVVEIRCTHRTYLKMMRELQAKNLNLEETERKGRYTHLLVDLK